MNKKEYTKFTPLVMNAAQKGNLQDVINATPVGIERSERNGTRQVATTELLPKDGNWKLAQKIGFEILGDSDDELFYKVKMPDGWSKRATGGRLISIYDHRDLRRGDINYKAAFYDRYANFILFENRFVVEQNFRVSEAIEMAIMDRGIQVEVEEEYWDKIQHTLPIAHYAKSRDKTGILWRDEFFYNPQGKYDRWDDYTEDYFFTESIKDLSSVSKISQMEFKYRLKDWHKTTYAINKLIITWGEKYLANFPEAKLQWDF